MYKVTTTMTSEVSTFETMEEVNAHIATEIKWFNSDNENKNGNGYDESDFVVEDIFFVIADKTENSGKPYIAEDLSNTGDMDSAWQFATEAEAQAVIDASNWEWAYITSN